MPTAQPRFCIQARRELMTETFSRTHGARTFDQITDRVQAHAAGDLPRTRHTPSGKLPV